MGEISLSLWLPVGRANFYSGTANGWLHEDQPMGVPEGKMVCSSGRIADPDYRPMLQASVIRRLLEVLPLSFGYETHGISQVSDEIDEHDRPTDLEIWLRPQHGPLSAAGVARLQLVVDEQGFYTFTAAHPDGLDATALARLKEALQAHICDVFGGAFTVNRLQERSKRVVSEGGAAVRRYSGLNEEDPAQRNGQPMGVLSFFQLNTIAEGLFNDTLSPAVFFEHSRFMRDFVARHEEGMIASATSVLHTIGHVIDVIVIETDAREDKGKIATLHHFLSVTAREVLQKLKWSVESVRRSLLDEMMGVLHRQSRLIQLDLGAVPGERTPELAVDATESQLRGYVMLISAKLPLIQHVHELAKLAEEHVGHRVTPTEDDVFRQDLHRDVVAGQVPARDKALRVDLHDLDVLQRSWGALLDGLAKNVTNLESAIQQAWMERLLYEQEQARSEQEAMAEIDRSHRSRPVGGRAGARAYNWLMLIFTILAVVVTLQTTENNRTSSLLDRMVGLWPILATISLIFVTDAVVSTIRRMIKDRRGVSQNYTYEFSFRLDEATNPDLVYRFINVKGRETIRLRRMRKLLVTRTGGARIERISPDTTLVKFHVIATLRVPRFRYARFEVVSEVLANRVSDQPRYVLRQSRIFGDSPVPLEPSWLIEIVDRLINYVALPLAVDESLGDLLDMVEPFFSAEKLAKARSTYGPWPADQSTPMSGNGAARITERAVARR